jgi:A/G-specific adenine glycosylase
MAFPVERLIDWFQKNKRDLPWRNTKNMYKTWLSEVMLQQTQVTTVIPYYQRFLQQFPNVKKLAQADSEAVLKLWEGLGYYNRCLNLHKAARLIESRFDGEIPETPEEFKELPGVGPYILAAVMSMARGFPLPAVDGNVIRVYCRFKGIADDARRPAVKNRITKELGKIIPIKYPGDFNEAMMELGALICLPRNPRCGSCPLSRDCVAKLTSRTGLLPFKSVRKEVPRYNVSIAVILEGGKFYIRKRPPGGHLGGMWEFPGGKRKGKESPEQTLIRECREELGAEVRIIEKLSNVRHAYSHFKIDMDVFLCKLPYKKDISALPQEQPFRWITIDQLHEFPFPGANHKFFPALKVFLKGI